MSRIFIDDKNSNSSSLLVEWELAAPANAPLEYMVSYADLDASSSSSAWINSSWTNRSEQLLTGLSAYTHYNVTVLVRSTLSPFSVFYPVVYVSVATKMGSPSAPWNVTVHQVSSIDVLVSWSPPTQLNGIVTQYRVYMTPPAPPMATVSRSTQLLLSYRFDVATNYSFQVAAENNAYAGEKSKSVWFVPDALAVLDTVSGLRVVDVDNSSVRIAWDPVANATAYEVIYLNLIFYVINVI